MFQKEYKERLKKELAEHEKVQKTWKENKEKREQFEDVLVNKKRLELEKRNFKIKHGLQQVRVYMP
jgi:ribosomal protein L17